MTRGLPEGCFVVAIDGPAGVGKSTTSRLVAERLHLGYLDTGAIYRAVALAVIERGIATDDGAGIAALAEGLDVSFSDGGTRVWCDGNEITSQIREPHVGQSASRVSANPEVRTALTSLQRAAARAPGIVAEGRDMGTVIFPDAGLKVFLSADARERARRRAAELAGRGAPAEVDAVLTTATQRPLLWVLISPTNWVCTMCLGMYPNGPETVLVPTTRVPPLMAVAVALSLVYWEF